LPENNHTPPPPAPAQRRDWNFLEVGGSVRPENLKKCMKLNWNFQRGGHLKKITSMRELWISSGTTQQQKIKNKIKGKS